MVFMVLRTPENIFVSFDGGVKILDFGIAKAANQVEMTRAGEIKGKLSYMSPEQCMGKPLDGRSDLFSLGVVLYEWVTGFKLFTGESDVGVQNLAHSSHHGTRGGYVRFWRVSSGGWPGWRCRR